MSFSVECCAHGRWATCAIPPLSGQLNVTWSLPPLDQVLFLCFADGLTARCQMGMDMCCPVSFGACLFLVIAQTLIEILRLADVAGRPGPRFGLLGEYVISWFFLEGCSNRVDLVVVLLARKPWPHDCWYFSHVVSPFVELLFRWFPDKPALWSSFQITLQSQIL